MTTYLTTEDLLTLVKDLDVGPVHDFGLLDSAAHRPRAEFYGREAYSSIDDKAAALLESIVGNHALVDGNKRLGWLAVVIFYGLNDIDLDAPDDDAFTLVMGVAQGHSDLNGVAASLARWQREPLDRLR